MRFTWFVRGYYSDDAEPPKVPGGFAIEIGGVTESALDLDVRVLRARSDIGRIDGPFRRDPTAPAVDGRAVSDDLVVFVRAQLDETERIARAAITGVFHRDRDPSDRLVPDGVWTQYQQEVTGIDIGIYEGAHSEEQAQHIAWNDPAATLASVAADRAILDEHPYDDQPCWRGVPRCGRCQCRPEDNPRNDGYDFDPPPWPCRTVRLLAQKFAGRPGWRDEWTMQP